MEFYDGELKREYTLEKIAADGSKWLWVCVGSTLALYVLLGIFGGRISEKIDAGKVCEAERTEDS